MLNQESIEEVVRSAVEIVLSTTSLDFETNTVNPAGMSPGQSLAKTAYGDPACRADAHKVRSGEVLMKSATLLSHSAICERGVGGA